MAWTATAAVGFALLYTLFFAVHRRLGLGGPDAWAEFGDYFGGVVNPLVGIVTVILVVRTLATTRAEASDTRAQLELQTKHMEAERKANDRAHVLLEMRVRLDGLLAEWHRFMELPLGNVTLVKQNGTGMEEVSQWKTRGSALNDPDFAFRISTLQETPWRNAARSEWLVYFDDAAILAKEFAIYCEDYEAVATNPVVADFYRRRIERAVVTLERMELISTTVRYMLRPEDMHFVEATAQT